MGATNATRISVQEGAYSFLSRRLSGILLELDMRLTGRGMFLKFIRSEGLIARTEFYRDVERTNLALSRDYMRVSGATGVDLISGVVTTFFEEDGLTVDSVVSGFLERDLTVSGQDFIICCSGFFDTDESEKV